MLKVLQNNTALQVVLILAVAALLWGPALATPPVMATQAGDGVLYVLLCRWLEGVPRLAVILALLLTLAEGIVLNLLLSDAGLVPQNSLLPTLLFVMAASVGTTTLSPMLLVCGLTLVCLDQLMLRTTLLTIPAIKVCHTTALIAVATMFYVPSVALLLTYLLVAANYRLYSWRDWMLLLLGFAAPYVMLLTVLYLTDGIAPWWNSEFGIRGLAFGSRGVAYHEIPIIRMAGYILLAAVLLWGLLRQNLRLGEHPVVWQKNASTVMLFTVGGIAMLPFAAPLSLSMLPFAIPFTFCTTRILMQATARSAFGSRRRHEWLYNIMLLLILIAAIVC